LFIIGLLMLNNKLKITQMYVADILKTSIIRENVPKSPDFIDFLSYATPKTPIFRA